MSVREMRDLVIVGGGPAGLAASIYAQRALLDNILLEKEAVGGQVITTADIDNYPGVPKADGFSLVDAMRTQAEDLGGKIVYDTVTGITRNDDGTFTVSAAGDTYDAKTVIVCGGASPRNAGFEGENGFTGKGVSYCATCDGMFYRGKKVYVIGGGNSACEEALFLTRFADHVDVVVRKDHLRAQAAVAQELENHPKVTVRYLTSIVGVSGDALISDVTLRNNETGETYVEHYDAGGVGVFVFVGRVPASQLLEGLVERDGAGYIITNERMETATPGLFAAGDVRAKFLRQIVTAASDGAIAATSASAYLGHPVEG